MNFERIFLNLTVTEGELFRFTFDFFGGISLYLTRKSIVENIFKFGSYLR